MREITVQRLNRCHVSGAGVAKWETGPGKEQLGMRDEAA